MSRERSISFIGNSAGILVVRACSILSSLLVMLYMSNLLTASDYGAFQSFWIQLSVFSVVAGLGIAAWSFTYNIKELSFIAQSISSQKYLLYFTGLVVVSFVFGIIQIRSNHLFASYGLLLPVAVYFTCFTLNIILEALVIIAGRYTLLIVTSIVYGLIFVLAHLAYIYKYIDWSLVILVLTLIALLKSLLLYSSIKKEISEKYKEAYLDRPQYFKSVKRLWLHVGFNDVFQSTIRWIDKLIITFILSNELAAVYVNATYEIPVFTLVASAVYSASLIKLNAIAGNKQDTLALLRTTSSLLGIFTFSSLCYFFFFAEEFIATVFSEKYLIGLSVFLVAIFKLPAKNFNLTGFLQHSNRGDIINKGTILDAFVSIALMYPLYLLWGLSGVALSIVISTFLQVLFYNYHSAKILEMNAWNLMPLKLWVIQIISFAIMAFLVHYILVALNLSRLWIMFGGIVIIGSIALLWMYMAYQKSKKKIVVWKA